MRAAHSSKQPGSHPRQVADRRGLARQHGGV